MNKKIIIGTRGSMLALKQAELIKKSLEEKNPDIFFEIKIIKTLGDISVDKSFSELPQKKLFVKEIEEELLENKVDIAVHSMKDMALVETEGLTTGAITKREDARDVLLSAFDTLGELPQGSIVGTGSARRRRQLEFLRPDLQTKEIRGNIDTRIEKLKNGQYDAIVLAAAGLSRGGIKYKNTYFFTTNEMIPAPGQGALGIQCRQNDDFVLNVIKTLNDEKTRNEVLIEREFSKIFDGGCKMPIGAFAVQTDGEIELKFFIEKDGKIIKNSVIGDSKEEVTLVEKAIKIINKKF